MNMNKRRISNNSVSQITEKFNANQNNAEYHCKNYHDKYYLSNKCDLHNLNNHPITNAFLQKNGSLSKGKHDPTLSSTVLALQRAKRIEQTPSNSAGKQILGKPYTRTYEFEHKKETDIQKFPVSYQRHPLSKNVVIHSNLKKNPTNNDSSYLSIKHVKSPNRNNHIINKHTSQNSSNSPFMKEGNIIVMSETSTNEPVESPGAPPPPPPGPPPPPTPVVSSNVSGNNGPKKQNSAHNGNTRSALLASIEKGTKLKPTKHIKDSSAPIIGNSSGNSGPSSSGENIASQQNTKTLNTIDKN